MKALRALERRLARTVFNLLRPTARTRRGTPAARGETEEQPMTTEPPSWFPRDIRAALDDKLGIEIVDWDPHRVVARMPVEGNTQPYGLLHGGAVCSLVETVGSYAAALGAGPGTRVLGIEINASYHLAVASGHVTAVCRPVPAEPPLATFRIEIFDDEERLTASARLTCMVQGQRADADRSTA